MRYGLLCNERGGVVDDVTVYRMSDDELLLCVNAANVDKDREWILHHAGRTRVDDRSVDTALLRAPGAGCARPARAPGRPRPRRAGALLASPPWSSPACSALVSRTGYTGSPGFEIYLDAREAEGLFERLLEAGRDLGVLPAGLGARDTLRLEAALPLYGHELDDDTSPLAARLDRFVKRDEGGFIGAEAIEARAAAGHPAVLVGFELEDRGVARAGYPVVQDGAAVGRVTSGGPSPTLGCSIGLAYVPPALAAAETPISIEVRGRALAARVVETPFVRARKREAPANTNPKRKR